MPNLRGASPVGRDVWGRSYAARWSVEVGPNGGDHDRGESPARVERMVTSGCSSKQSGSKWNTLQSKWEWDGNVQLGVRKGSKPKRQVGSRGGIRGLQGSACGASAQLQAGGSGVPARGGGVG